MKKEQEPCKYCGAKTYYGDICPNCYRKRDLVREMKESARALIARLNNIRETPCDFCDHYPPTSDNNNPCSRCPAMPRRTTNGMG